MEFIEDCSRLFYSLYVIEGKLKTISYSPWPQIDPMGVIQYEEWPNNIFILIRFKFNVQIGSICLQYSLYYRVSILESKIYGEKIVKST